MSEKNEVQWIGVAAISFMVVLLLGLIMQLDRIADALERAHPAQEEAR